MQHHLDEAPEDLARGLWSDCAAAEEAAGPGAPKRRCALNGVDRAARSALAARSEFGRVRGARLSDATVLATVALPLSVAQAARPEHRERDLLVAAETFAVTGLLNDVVKRAFDRPRPFVHHCDPLRVEDLCDADAQYSFYSGHTSTAFAMAVAAGRMSSFHGHQNGAWVYGVGLTLATTTGLLRMVADKHYLTDVLVGAGAGTLTALLVTELHRPRADSGTAVRRVPRPGSALLAVPLPGGEKSGLLRVGVAAGPFAEVAWRW